MKKFTKVILLIAVSLLGFGALLGLVGFACGGGKTMMELTRSGVLPYRLGRLNVLDLNHGLVMINDREEMERLDRLAERAAEDLDDWADGVEEGLDGWADGVEDGVEHWTENFVDGMIDGAAGRMDDDEDLDDYWDDDWVDETGDRLDREAWEAIPYIFQNGSGSADASHISELKVKVRAAMVQVEPSEDEKIRCEVEGDLKVKFYQSGDKLYIYEMDEKNKINDYDRRKLILSIPEDKTFREVEIDAGGAMVQGSGLKGESVELNAGAAEISLEGVEAVELDASIGAGKLNLTDFVASDVSVEIGAGMGRLDGEITGKLEGGCSMGSLEIKLKGKQTDYNYSLECGIGDIRIGRESYTGLSNEKYIDNGASSLVELECVVGRIELEFEE